MYRIVADVELDNRQSLYLRYGDWFAGACLCGCVLIAGARLCEKHRSHAAQSTQLT